MPITTPSAPTDNPSVAIMPAKRPDITPAQIVGLIPLLAEFGHTWGIFSLSQPQQDSLSKLVLGGIALFGADAVIRFGRNLAHGLSTRR